MASFETDNLQAYVLLLRIEIVLRECLRASLESEFGVHWQKKLLGALLTKIKDSQMEENRPQFDFVRLGPLYYLTFGELLVLLQQKSGRSVAQRLGGEGILSQLANILVPRNAICHSRPVSSVGLKAIQTLYAEIEAALTADEVVHLLTAPDIGLAQDDAVKKLINALTGVLIELPHLPQSLTDSEIFKTAIVQFWWASDELAGFNRFTVETSIALIREYNSLPAGVGSAGIRQSFREERGIERVVQNAVSELERGRL